MPKATTTRTRGKTKGKTKRNPTWRSVVVERPDGFQGRGIYQYTSERLLPMDTGSPVPDFRIRPGARLVYDAKGRSISPAVVRRALVAVNAWLAQHMDTKFALAKSGKRVSSLDVHGKKAIGNFIGRALCDNVQDITWHSKAGLRNTPIDSGCPDLIPADRYDGNYDWRRFRHGGIEVKVTCGRLKSGAAAELRYEDSRIAHLSGFTWMAHHPQSRRVLGLLWDNVRGIPQVVGAFFTNTLSASSYGNCKPDLSTRAGNSTNAGAIKRRGLDRFGWVCMYDDEQYIEAVRRMMPHCGL